ncbi:hypothetical protein NDU88_001874 [Pleurodeles waltl]|uniref:Uncharacterized protein n=1 Tax=Pleurodeles waltl TaxID=8319 RepID=A0AAV7VCR5_PLEWA|nr:hypothetical protein NDU88_001874 [Pleurodeles waltl]
MRRLPAGPRAPPPCFRNPGAPEGDPLQWAGAAREVRGRPQHAPRANRRRNKEEEGGVGEPRPESTAGQASPESSAPLSPRLSIRGSGRRLRSPRAHLRSQGAQRAAGARPLDAPRLPDPGSSQTRPKHRRPASRGEAPGVRSISAPIRMDLSG